MPVPDTDTQIPYPYLGGFLVDDTFHLNLDESEPSRRREMSGTPAPVASAWKIIPTFESDDIARTLEFYVGTLGFTLASTKPEDGDPSLFTFCSIFAGEKAAANIYFFKPSGRSANPGSAYIALGTTQLDQLHDSLKAQGDVEFADEIQDQPWGFRQFAVKDPDRNTLTFFKYLEGGNPGDE